MDTCQENAIHPEAIQNAQKTPLNADQFETLVKLFKALAEPTRAKILWFLLQTELCVCDLGHLIGMSKSATSHQLAYLFKLNLVKKRKEGRVVYYSIADDHVSILYKNALEHAAEGKELEA
ncbi:metalloregulator ArsR/SmtB family transcription factor [Facklamia sp. 7083-14-GEN3]|uniref:ArsR/SmtB family transcription factor n=1 Tax=Facklamia sp. 7083-14-GEN3 TaxID=2973478 RepID=UPI00215BF870|nr:metalloregulator ArsR/SmtB family transcription factor [Facklamia sp. 7083-14-GEN3]MCR8969619.1 metalloregulator ArsR/SmtB family transcription factor [Facklamia sp. 7083-14-GEN3]